MSGEFVPPVLAGRGERHSLSFSSYGVGILVEADGRGPLDWLRTQLGALLAGRVQQAGEGEVDHVFSLRTAPDGSVSFFLDGESICTRASPRVALDYLASRIKLAVGEFATSHVFVHAGVVGIGGGAIVLPGSSCQGKTTLVRELVLRGAVYFSDDFALVDRQGLVSPFPKTLSVRPEPGDLRQVEYPVESLGGVAAEVPLRVDAVLFTHYDPASQWNPREIAPGEALLKLTPHTLPIRVAPQRSLESLSRMVTGAGLWASPRGEGREVVDWLFDSLPQDRSGPRP